jgi:hypothetical protein
MVAETSKSHRLTGETPEMAVTVNYLTDNVQQPGKIDLHRKGWALI